MPKQAEPKFDKYNEIFPTTLRELLSSHPKDGHTTTYKALGEAVGVRQQTISLYASGQTMPPADVVLRIAKYFGVSMDYLFTGISSDNKEINIELGLSEASIDFLKRARDMFGQVDAKNNQMKTMPYLDELLSDKKFYEFLDGLYYYVEGLGGKDGITDEMKEQFKGLNIEGYFIWQLQMYVQDFIQKELNMLGLCIKME